MIFFWQKMATLPRGRRHRRRSSRKGRTYNNLAWHDEQPSLQTRHSPHNTTTTTTTISLNSSVSLDEDWPHKTKLLEQTHTYHNRTKPALVVVVVDHAPQLWSAATTKEEPLTSESSSTDQESSSGGDSAEVVVVLPPTLDPSVDRHNGPTNPRNSHVPSSLTTTTEPSCLMSSSSSPRHTPDDEDDHKAWWLVWSTLQSHGAIVAENDEQAVVGHGILRLLYQWQPSRMCTLLPALPSTHDGGGGGMLAAMAYHILAYKLSHACTAVWQALAADENWTTTAVVHVVQEVVVEGFLADASSPWGTGLLTTRQDWSLLLRAWSLTMAEVYKDIWTARVSQAWYVRIHCLCDDRHVFVDYLSYYHVVSDAFFGYWLYTLIFRYTRVVHHRDRVITVLLRSIYQMIVWNHHEEEEESAYRQRRQKKKDNPLYRARRRGRR